jgi:predicted phage terminase large subunit-like protein
LKQLGLESLPQEAWEQILWSSLRELARTDPLAYGEYAFRLRPAPHHAEMVQFIESRINNPDPRQRNAVILEPRGHAKTTWGNNIYLSWLLSKHPNLRVGLISNTALQARAFSRGIRNTLEMNEYHHNVFGNLTGTHKWTDVEWIMKGSSLHGTPYLNMYAQGAGGAIISKRFDLIFCDDILDEENCATPEQREKLELWFWKTLKPCLAPGGSIIVLGTRWAEGDLYQVLMEDKKWPSLVRGAIYYTCSECGVNFGSDQALEKHVTTSLCANAAPAEQKALWPEMWPLDALEAERRDMGSAMFACSYLNDISGLMAGNIFRRDWFQYFEPSQINPSHLVWKMGVDLASSEKQRADYTARVVIGEDEQRNVYIYSVVRDKIETGHRGFIGDGYETYPDISKIVVENNQFQGSFVKDLLAQTSWPVVGKKSEVDKVTRARSVAARYEARKVFHSRSLEGTDFEIELLQFPKGHDDQIDALGLAMETGSGGAFFGALT